MNKTITITKLPPKQVAVSKVPPKVITVSLARPTVTIETSWKSLEW